MTEARLPLQGVRIYDGHSLRTLGRADGLVGDEVRSMLEDRAHTLWVGTTSGLTHLADSGPRSWTRVDDSPRTLYVRALLQDRQGQV